MARATLAAAVVGLSSAAFALALHIRRRRRLAAKVRLAPAAHGGVAALAAAYRTGTTSPVEAVEHCLAAISALDGIVGAFQEVYAAEARAAAHEAAAALKAGRALGPFHGIPFALKDLVDVEGRVTTAGSAARKNHVATSTAVVAARLLAAGGILIGKVKTVEFAAGAWGINMHMGSPRNPWDAEVHRVTAGSSSGSGAAVAAGMVPCAVGTDTGGSVRLPAAFCGVVGLKTTYELLPREGIAPLSHSLDTVGPLARSVEDAALMLDAMLPPETNPLSAFLGAGVAGLHFASVSDADRRTVSDPRQLAAYDAALELLQSLGARITPINLEWVPLAGATGLIAFAEGYHHHKALVDDPDALLDDAIRDRLVELGNKPAHVYIDALMARQPNQRLFLEELGGRAALLLPTTPMLPPPLASVDPASACSHFTRTANYLGLCAISLPTGLTSPTEDEPALPTAMQIVCRPNEEALALRIAAAYEAARGPLLATPPLAHPPFPCGRES